jgi:hypothetical protein
MKDKSKQLKFLIELSGSAKDCLVVPTCGRDFTTNHELDYNKLKKAGLDGFVYLSNHCDIAIPHCALGQKTYIQLELKYPWTKHSLISNVPIKKFCMRGYLDSIFHVVKSKIISLAKTIKAGV